MSRCLRSYDAQIGLERHQLVASDLNQSHIHFDSGWLGREEVLNDFPFPEKMGEFELLRDIPEGEEENNEEERNVYGGCGRYHNQTTENANEDEEDLNVSLL